MHVKTASYFILLAMVLLALKTAWFQITANSLSKLGTILILVGLVSFAACHRDPNLFDREDWLEHNDEHYLYRDAMVRDLLENHLYEGMSTDTILELLGKPDNIEVTPDRTFWYNLKNEMTGAGDPAKMKTLFILFANDSTVTGFKVEEWNFK
jgi:outer membrane protein assembly factor BamE (lipoprotein component of BamABCDE complex)